MIKLSGLKVSRQYRWRVQQRLVVLEYAEGQGMAAAARRFGVSPKTVRRWRGHWRPAEFSPAGPFAR